MRSGVDLDVMQAESCKSLEANESFRMYRAFTHNTTLPADKCLARDTAARGRSQSTSRVASPGAGKSNKRVKTDPGDMAGEGKGAAFRSSFPTGIPRLPKMKYGSRKTAPSKTRQAVTPF